MAEFTGTKQSRTRCDTEMNEQEPRVISERIISQEGALIKGERFLEGWHPGPNRLLTMGWSGQETIESFEGIKPAIVVTVTTEEPVVEHDTIRS